MRKKECRGGLDFWQLARDYLRSYCKNACALSDKTVDAYRIGLESYISYLHDDLALERKDITMEYFEHSHVRGYLRWMREVKEYAERTVALRLTVVKSFLRYASYEDITMVSVYKAVSTIKAPRQAKKPVAYMTDEATAAILAAYSGNTRTSRRNRMLLVLLYDSAARISEIAGACIGDLHLGSPPFISLTGKGGKTRNMPLMGKTVEHLKVYLDEFHPGWSKLTRSTPLFYCRRNGGPCMLSVDAVSVILKEAGRIARPDCRDVPARLHCHLVRKTRAMNLYEDGTPLPLIMQMLGHESMSTTSTFYAFATMGMMTDAIAAANPEVIGETPTWYEDSIAEALYRL